MVKLVGKTKSAPYAAMPENSDPSGSRATVILKGNRFGGDNCCGATADERPMRVGFGSWSCKNALAVALTPRDFGDDAVRGDFSAFGGFSVRKRF